MSHSQSREVSRRHFLSCVSASAVAVTTGTSLARATWTPGLQAVHKVGSLEVLVTSDGHFFLPTDFLVAPDSPPAERQAVLKAAAPVRRSDSAPQQRRRDQSAGGPDSG